MRSTEVLRRFYYTNICFILETENLLGFGNFETVYKGFVKEKEAAKELYWLPQSYAQMDLWISIG